MRCPMTGAAEAFVAGRFFFVYGGVGKSRYGAIDVGTNSVRLLIASREGEQVVPLHREMETTRIGAGTRATGRLSPAGAARTLAVLRRYRGVLAAWQVGRARAVATSAVREASNGAEFAVRASRVLGFPLEVIGGREEAYLSYQGAARGLPGVERPLVVDIGGGSTELTWLRDGQLQAHSLPLGAVGVTENPSLLDLLDDYQPLLAELAEQRGITLVGVGGTATTLAAIEQGMTVYDPQRVQGYPLERAAVERIWRRLAGLPLAERRQVAGLQPARADIILAGIRILLEIMRRTGRDRLIVGESDLLYGMVWELSEGQRGGGAS